MLKANKKLKIIDDICNGNLDTISLASHRNHNCRKSEEEIAKALVSNEREDYLFGLRQEYDRYQFYTSKLEECDQQIGLFLNQVICLLAYLLVSCLNKSRDSLNVLIPIKYSSITLKPIDLCRG